MNAFPLLLLLAVAPCALGNPVANYLKNLAESATVQSMTLNHLECQGGNAAKTADGKACKPGKHGVQTRLFEIKNLKCTVKALKQTATCVSGTVEVGPPTYVPPMSVSETEINLADKTGKILLKTPRNWKKYGFTLDGGIAYIEVDAQGISQLVSIANARYQDTDKMFLSMQHRAVYARAIGKLEARVEMTVQVGKRTGKNTDIPQLILVGVGTVVQGNPTLTLTSTAETGSQGWKPFANGPYANGLRGQATITDAGLSAVRLDFEVGWSDIVATLPTDIDFNNCPAPSCKTAKDCDWWGNNCKWTGDPSFSVAAKALLKGAAWAATGLGRRSLLFGPLPPDGSTPLDGPMPLSDPNLDPFVGGVRVGDSTVFAGDMEGYAEDADPDELSLGTESLSFTDKGIALDLLDHKCEWKLTECPVKTATSRIQVKVGGFLQIDVKKGEVWGKVELKSDGGVAVFPFSRPIDLGFSGAVFEQTASNKLNIMSALDDLSFCALVNTATENGMGSLPIKWAGKAIESDDIYEKVLGKWGYLACEDDAIIDVTGGKACKTGKQRFLDMGKVLGQIIGQDNVNRLGELSKSSRDALKIKQDDLPEMTIPVIPAYSGTLGSAFSALGGDKMCA